MNFIIDQMVQLQHVDVTNRYLPVEGLSGRTIMKRDLAR